MASIKRKMIKPVVKEKMVSLNVIVPERVKKCLWDIGLGSPSKGVRNFCETFREELDEAAKNARKASNQ